MDNQFALVRRDAVSLTRRDFIRPVFQYRRWGLMVFLAISTVVLLAALLWPLRYDARMKILVLRERVDPVMSAESTTATFPRPDVSDSEVLSEVELLKSRDVLEHVAIDSGLLGAVATPRQSPDNVTLSRAVRRLETRLSIAPVRKTTLINVTYSSSDPRQAARVLQSFWNHYFEKHLALHRPAASREFFATQTDRLQQELRAAERRLVEFGQRNNLVSAVTEKASSLQQLATFEATEAQLRAEIAEVHRRRQALGTASTKTPPRQTTSLRQQDNGDLIRDLKTKVLDLELQRADMLPKFASTYPPLVELEQKLAQARAALTHAEKTPLKEETTDQNPTHQWIQSELARAEADDAALRARLAQTSATVAKYRGKAQTLDGQSAQQEELIRAVKTAEDNYLRYQKKAEEARISDAFDASRISNVVLAEAPAVPALPANGNRLLWIVAGVFLGLVAGAATTYLLDSINPRFRTREEVQVVLELPVLAALPGPLPR